ncbi:MAG: hypothetical protein ACE14M_16810 [Terriglobales bacterium]
MEAARSRSVNVRSYRPDRPEGNAFYYGVSTATEAISLVSGLAAQGCYTIINETIDVNDGGVSGVAVGGVIEFAPGDTPRCVEKPGTALLPRQQGLELLAAVYGFEPRIPSSPALRVEFSLHPQRQGFERDHTIVWETESYTATEPEGQIAWPNRFSRFIGDKAFGLLVAHVFGLPVPRTTVIARKVAPFTFGVPTGTGEVWLRTCPVEQVPGRYTTVHGWQDPFELLQREDPSHSAIAAVIRQDAVEPCYSGATICSSNSSLIIEGVAGAGDRFMVGETGPIALPEDVQNAVSRLFDRAFKDIGRVRFEWVFDGNQAWLVQLHCGAALSSSRTIYPGLPRRYRDFFVKDGLDVLRRLIEECQLTGDGISVVGDIGITSHVGDLLRKARIPSLLKPIGG